MRAVMGALVGVLVVGGCSDDTGVLVRVSRDSRSTPADIEELQFFVGVQIEPGVAIADARFLEDVDVDGSVVPMDGRDLADEPYRLMLRPGTEMDAERELMVAVVARRDGDRVGFGTLPEGARFLEGKVAEWEIVLTGEPGAVRITETGCLAWTASDDAIVIASPDDRDCDGDPADTDCDDDDGTRYHGATETCENGIDEDCDDSVDEETDTDGDGVTNCAGDCDDNNDAVAPGKAEICDGLDNDCNDFCDDGALDADDDHYTVCERKILGDGTCSDPDPALQDCNDDDAEINPGADEPCDGVDNDCNGICDDGHDPDGDLYTECGSETALCDGVRTQDVDCATDDPKINPGARELCNGKDDNCDGSRFPATGACYVADGGECHLGTRPCNDEATGWSGTCTPVDVADDRSAPATLCEAYQTCEESGSLDPFRCANDAVTAAATHDCTVLFDASGSLCPNAEVVLPNQHDTGCIWSVLRAGEDTSYEVGVRPLDDSTEPAIVTAVCDAVFSVLASKVEPPEHDAYLVWQRHVQGDTLLRFKLSPMSVNDCPASGLSCPQLPAPGDN